jgi:hypothetical protein
VHETRNYKSLSRLHIRRLHISQRASLFSHSTLPTTASTTTNNPPASTAQATEIRGSMAQAGSLDELYQSDSFRMDCMKVGAAAHGHTARSAAVRVSRHGLDQPTAPTHAC